MDPRIDDFKADELKASWVHNSMTGRADAALVVLQENMARGFVVCMFDGETATIDLIAVASSARGAGLGKQLVKGALDHYGDRAQKMSVGTQDTNAASIALYQGFGFREIEQHITFHWINPRVAI